MGRDLVEKLVLGKEVTEKDVEYALYELCEDNHSSCNPCCPVYDLNNGMVSPDKPFEESRGCDCFGNGKKMAEFIRNHQERE